MAVKNCMRDPGGGENLYFDCKNVSILVLILFYSFARCYHWGKPHVNQQLSRNNKFTEKNNEMGGGALCM